ncbi:hypothetical protein CKO43_23820 [Rubrivivax gelatinosus]|uniref:TauD/TfdA-like domain-containing protein n=2 Tax=Rubrivivax gelatinosus TaxID=28068 RepID=A0ABS1E115_RUBGE|nr:hypothetical protein [Rubrivivax gelatinosus]
MLFSCGGRPLRRHGLPQPGQSAGHRLKALRRLRMSICGRQLAARMRISIDADVVLIANVGGGLLGNDELHAHYDHHWTPQPSASSFLHALEVPSRGGDTTWINAVLAYETLDEATRREIDDLQLITYNPFLRRLRPLASGRAPLYRTPEIEPLSPYVAHPLVRTHPDSGKRLLYLDTHTEVEVLGWPARRGAALVERLRAHLLQPRLAYTHRWSVGDLVWWDNQATIHSRSAFEAGERRVMKRVSLAGTRPF